MLEIDGGNWPIFWRKFETYMDGAGFNKQLSHRKLQRYQSQADKEGKQIWYWIR